MPEVPATESVEGDVVRGTNTVAATHTSDLDLSAMGIGFIPAPHRQVSMTLGVAWTVENDRISHMAATMPGGPDALLEQLGVPLPNRSDRFSGADRRSAAASRLSRPG